MAAEIWLERTQNGLSFGDEESRQWFMSKPVGKTILARVSVPRNAAFHRKAMKLLQFAFENLQEQLPKGQYKGKPVEVTFEQFRRDMVIWAGHGKPVVRINGKIEIEPQSLSYSECSQELIEKIYSDLLDLISKKFSQLAKTPEELDRLTDEWMRFV